MSCYSENEIAPVALDIIRRNPGIRTSELINELMNEMQPNGEDLEILAGRNDTKFSQKVRNIKSHDTLINNVTTIDERNRQWFAK